MNENRRRLLQALTISGAALTARAVPEHWAQPLVQAVIVPSHAQATGEEFADSVSVLLDLDLGDAQPVSESPGLLAQTLREAMEIAVPNARALLAEESYPTDVCVRRRAGNTFDVRVIFYHFDATDQVLAVFEEEGIPFNVETDISVIAFYCHGSQTCKLRITSANGTVNGLVSVSGSGSVPFVATPGIWPPLPEPGCVL